MSQIDVEIGDEVLYLVPDTNRWVSATVLQTLDRGRVDLDVASKGIRRGVRRGAQLGGYRTYDEAAEYSRRAAS